MKRREFITLLGGAAAWPLAARTQPAMPVIGFLSSLAHTDLGLVIPGFHEGLNGEGFVASGVGPLIPTFRTSWAQGSFDVKCQQETLDAGPHISHLYSS